MRKKKHSRRTFLQLGAASLVSSFAGCTLLGLKAEMQPKRIVLVCSDLHIGYSEDASDGAQWFSIALSDIQSGIGPVDYAMVLGDIAHDGALEQYQEYHRICSSSHIAEWYELAGNHDWTAEGVAAYCAEVSDSLTYAIIDGNVIWIILSDEAYSTEGEISDETYTWLCAMISRYGKDKNIIVCSHQLVYNTVANPYIQDDRYLFMNGAIADKLSALPVDLWICGHEHHYPWNGSSVYFNGRTTFINISSIHHCYNTGESHSFILELEQESKIITAYRRIHDTAESVDGMSIPVSFPIVLSEPSQRVLCFP